MFLYFVPGTLYKSEKSWSWSIDSHSRRARETGLRTSKSKLGHLSPKQEKQNHLIAENVITAMDTYIQVKERHKDELRNEEIA